GSSLARGDARVAVLPFKPLTPGRTDWIGPGLAETLTAALGGVPELRVVERAQLRAVTRELDLGSDEGGARAGRRGAAQHILVGSFQVAGGELLVNGRFVDVATGVVLPGKTFALRGRVERLFDLYPKLASEALAALGVRAAGRTAEVVDAASRGS